jgi:predicted transcriptional regulator
MFELGRYVRQTEFRQALDKRGVSLAAVARVAQIPYSSLEACVNGRARMTARTAKRVKAALDEIDAESVEGVGDSQSSKPTGTQLGRRRHQRCD